MARKASAHDQLVLLLIILVSLNACCSVRSKLTANFYSKTCPNVPTIVRDVMAQAVQKEARLAASILRLFFHDCFVQACDASILLDDTPTFKGEKTANPNFNSVRGFEVIDSIKTQVEAACKGVVSCADILALAARDGVVLSNGPSWTVLLGRRDSTTASFSGANTNLPSPASNLSELITKFQAQGLSVQDLVALSGAHTFGQARCVSFRARLYNQSGSGAPDPTLNATYRVQLATGCPASGGDNNLAPLDVHTPTTFDSRYYANLVGHLGLLNSDQVLYSTPGSSTSSLVTSFASNQAAFFNAFTTAMIRMGNLHPLTGTQGQIRANCRSIN